MNRSRQQYAVIAISVIAISYGLACEPKESPKPTPSTPIGRFEQLLGQREKPDGVDMRSHEEFVTLIRNHSEVREYIVNNFSRMSFVGKNDTILVIRNMSPEATFAEFNVLIVESAQDSQFTGRVAAIHALRYYDVPERKPILQSHLQLRPVNKHFYPILSSMRVYLQLYGAADVEGVILEILDATVSERERLQLAAVVAALGEGRLAERGQDMVNDILDAGFDSRYPAHAGRAFSEMVNANRAGDERLHKHALRLKDHADQNLRDDVTEYIKTFHSE